MARAGGTRMEELLATAERLADLGSFELVLPSMERIWSDGMYRIHGIEPGAAAPTMETVLAHVHPEDRARVAATIRSAVRDPGSFPAEGAAMEYRVVLADGSIRVLRGIGHAEAAGDGRPARWFGVVQDITEQRLTERDLQAHYAVSQALREWEDVEDGLVALLRRMATALDYPAGCLWAWDRRSESVVARALWSHPDADLDEFITSTLSLSFGPGEGIPGHVYVTCEPQFVPEIADDPRFVGRQDAADAGLRSVLAFPAMADAPEPIAILVFYSRDRREPSARLVRTLTSIGGELGRFLDRRRAQLEPSPLSARELQVLKLASEGLSGPKIAERLVVSPSTIKTHFENIYEKLGVSDRAGAVGQALRIGLFS